MEISDLIGLSKPLERSIEVFSKGVGTLSKSYFIKKEAQAKAKEIDLVAEAIAKATGKKDLIVTYNAGEVGIWPNQNDRTYNPSPIPLEERAKARIDYQERKKQHNLENITSTAAIELIDETEIPDESPDEDWINRFFEYAPNVSTEHMQDLWGRILAGEIKRPGAFSLRTLGFLKNITTEEAKLFEDIAKLAVWGSDEYLGVPLIDLNWLKEKRQIGDRHFFILREIGLLLPTSQLWSFFDNEKASKGFMVSNTEILQIEKASRSPIEAFFNNFSSIGKELLGLIDTPSDMEYIEFVGRFLVKKGAKVSIVRIKGILPNGSPEYEVIKDLTL